jgi:hypothetical protein
MKTDNSVAFSLDTTKQETETIVDSLGTKDTEKVVLAKEELIVIPDECGDTLWEAVLAQEKNKS